MADAMVERAPTVLPALVVSAARVQMLQISGTRRKSSGALPSTCSSFYLEAEYVRVALADTIKQAVFNAVYLWNFIDPFFIFRCGDVHYAFYEGQRGGACQHLTRIPVCTSNSKHIDVGSTTF